MKIEVSDEVISFINSINRPAYPSRVVRILKWFSENPEGEAKFLQMLKKFNKRELNRLSTEITMYEPDEAIEKVAMWGERLRNSLSLMRKIIKNTENNKTFEFVLKNGVKCLVNRDEQDFEHCFKFSFFIEGKEIAAFLKKRNLYSFIEGLINFSDFFTYMIDSVTYEGKPIDRKIIAVAIKNNVTPEIAALIGEEG